MLKNVTIYFEPFTLHDPQNVFFDTSTHTLSAHKKALPCKDLNFAIPPKNLNYTYYLLPFELLYRDIDALGIPDNDKHFIQSRLRDCALMSYRDVHKINDSNLPKEEHASLNHLINNKNLAI